MPVFRSKRGAIRYIRRSKLRRGRPLRYAKPGRWRMYGMVQSRPSFTETFNMPAILGNAGGILNVSMDMLPQLAQYSALYRQYRINWVKFTLIPNGNSYDTNQVIANQGVTGWASQPRIAYSIDTTPGITVPLTEQEVLEDNGAKVRVLSKPVMFSCRPVVEQQLQAGVVAERQKFRQFLNFAPAGTANPPHNGIRFYITQAAAPGYTESYNLYVKVSFTLRDPQ